jgi:hypothetical protein
MSRLAILPICLDGVSMVNSGVFLSLNRGAVVPEQVQDAPRVEGIVRVWFDRGTRGALGVEGILLRNAAVADRLVDVVDGDLGTAMTAAEVDKQSEHGLYVDVRGRVDLLDAFGDRGLPIDDNHRVVSRSQATGARVVPRTHVLDRHADLALPRVMPLDVPFPGQLRFRDNRAYLGLRASFVHERHATEVFVPAAPAQMTAVADLAELLAYLTSLPAGSRTTVTSVSPDGIDTESFLFINDRDGLSMLKESNGELNTAWEGMPRQFSSLGYARTLAGSTRAAGRQPMHEVPPDKSWSPLPGVRRAADFIRNYGWLQRSDAHRDERDEDSANCLLVAIAVDLTLKERAENPSAVADDVYFQAPPSGMHTVRNLLNYAQRELFTAKSYEAVHDVMAAAPVGARAIVVVAESDGRVAHAINTTRDDLGPAYLDGKTKTWAWAPTRPAWIGFVWTSADVPDPAGMERLLDSSPWLDSALGGIGLEIELHEFALSLPPSNSGRRRRGGLSLNTQPAEPLHQTDIIATGPRGIVVKVDSSGQWLIPEVVTPPGSAIRGESRPGGSAEGLTQRALAFVREMRRMQVGQLESLQSVVSRVAGWQAVGKGLHITVRRRDISELGRRDPLYTQYSESLLYSKVVEELIADLEEAQYVDEPGAELSNGLLFDGLQIGSYFGSMFRGSEENRRILEGALAIVYPMVVAPIMAAVMRNFLQGSWLAKHLINDGSRLTPYAIRAGCPESVQTFLTKNAEAIRRTVNQTAHNAFVNQIVPFINARRVVQVHDVFELLDQWGSVNDAGTQLRLFPPVDPHDERMTATHYLNNLLFDGDDENGVPVRYADQAFTLSIKTQFHEPDRKSGLPFPLMVIEKRYIRHWADEAGIQEYVRELGRRQYAMLPEDPAAGSEPSQYSDDPGLNGGLWSSSGTTGPYSRPSHFADDPIPGFGHLSLDPTGYASAATDYGTSASAPQTSATDPSWHPGSDGNPRIDSAIPDRSLIEGVLERVTRLDSHALERLGSWLKAQTPEWDPVFHALLREVDAAVPAVWDRFTAAAGRLDPGSHGQVAAAVVAYDDAYQVLAGLIPETGFLSTAEVVESGLRAPGGIDSHASPAAGFVPGKAEAIGRFFPEVFQQFITQLGGLDAEVPTLRFRANPDPARVREANDLLAAGLRQALLEAPGVFAWILSVERPGRAPRDLETAELNRVLEMFRQAGAYPPVVVTVGEVTPTVSQMLDLYGAVAWQLTMKRVTADPDALSGGLFSSNLGRNYQVRIPGSVTEGLVYPRIDAGVFRSTAAAAASASMVAPAPAPALEILLAQNRERQRRLMDERPAIVNSDAFLQRVTEMADRVPKVPAVQLLKPDVQLRRLGFPAVVDSFVEATREAKPTILVQSAAQLKAAGTTTAVLAEMVEAETAGVTDSATPEAKTRDFMVSLLQLLDQSTDGYADVEAFVTSNRGRLDVTTKINFVEALNDYRRSERTDGERTRLADIATAVLRC